MTAFWDRTHFERNLRDEVRRVSCSGLSDREWGGGGGVSASGERPVGASGDAWVPRRAQAMLNLCATYLNGDWDSFWAYHVEQEDGRLYRKLGETG